MCEGNTCDILLTQSLGDAHRLSSYSSASRECTANEDGIDSTNIRCNTCAIYTHKQRTPEDIGIISDSHISSDCNISNIVAIVNILRNNCINKRRRNMLPHRVMLRTFLIIFMQLTTTICYCNSEATTSTNNTIVTAATIASATPATIITQINGKNTTTNDEQLTQQLARTSTLIQGLSVALGVTTIEGVLDANAVAENLKSNTGEFQNGQTTISTNYTNSNAGIAPNKATLLTAGHSIVTFINRENVLKSHHTTVQALDSLPQAANIADAATGTNPSSSSVRGAGSSSCPSCQLREKAKLDNLESIKMHILMRLQLKKLPNITEPIPVPQNIIKNFYKNYSTSGRYHNKVSSSGTAGEVHNHVKAANAEDSDLTRANRHRLLYMKQQQQQQQQQASSAASHYEAHTYAAVATANRHDDDNVHQFSDNKRSNNNYSNGNGGSDDVDNNDEIDSDGDDDEEDAGIDHDFTIQSDDPYAFKDYATVESDPIDRIDRIANIGDVNNSGYTFDDSIDDFQDDKQFEDTMNDDIDDELFTDHEFFSTQHSVYIFPTVTGSRIRHNRKSEVLNFKFENNYASISQVIMHIYIYGREEIRLQDAKLEGRDADAVLLEKRGEIVIAVHRAVRCINAINCTHTIKLNEVRHKIPSGHGQWVQIELNQLANYWTEQHNNTQSIVIKTAKPWMRPFIVTSDGQDKPYTVHIEITTQDKRRRKRSTSLDCQESDHEVRCCRYPLKVNFTNFGWHFVVAPTSFDAYFCNGECKVGYLEQYTHTHLASLTTSATPCCSPTKMSSLSLLYFDTNHNLVLSTIPNMSVEKCSCS